MSVYFVMCIVFTLYVDFPIKLDIT